MRHSLERVAPYLLFVKEKNYLFIYLKAFSKDIIVDKMP